MRNLKLLFPICLTLLPLSGCKVPDIKPFAAATTEMTSTIGAGLDQVLSALSTNAKLELSAERSSILATSKNDFMLISSTLKKQLTSFDKYARTLVELSEAGDQGKATVKKLATVVTNISAVFPPVAAVGSAASAAATAIADSGEKIATLNKLHEAMEPADVAIQNAASLLDANLRDLVRIDSSAGALLNNELRKQNNDLLKGYRDLLVQQQRAGAITGLLVGFENSVAAHTASAADFSTLQNDLAALDAKLPLPLSKPGPGNRTPSLSFNPTEAASQQAALAGVAQLKKVWQKRRDTVISPELQHRYDLLQAELSANETTTLQHLSVLRKSRALVKAWATGHQSMKQAVTDQRHSVSFQEVLEGAANLKGFIDTLQTSSN